MRVVLDLDRPTSGVALVKGHDYTESQAPLAGLGALLDATAVDKFRPARNHLLALGPTVGGGARRVEEVLGPVGLTEVARKPAGSFSLAWASGSGSPLRCRPMRRW